MSEKAAESADARDPTPSTEPPDRILGLAFAAFFTLIMGVHAGTLIASEPREAELPAPGAAGGLGLGLPAGVITGVIIALLTLVFLLVRDGLVARNLPTDARSRIAHSLAAVAARLAGGRHTHLAESWLADLRGTPEEGRPLPPHGQLRHARGCLLAAARIRLADVTGWVGRRVDSVLCSEKRICAVIAAMLATMACYLLTAQGLAGLVTNAENVVVTGAGLYGAARVLRRVRGHSPEP